ncbi:MAG: adenylosuccinate lyase, partial [Candidatus Bathyarchaeia archaeon]
PEACILVDYMLNLMIWVLSNLEVDEEKMLKNIDLTQGRALSEAVMIALVKKGMGRQEAHEVLRQLAIKSASEKMPFREVLVNNDLIRRFLTEEEIDEALDPKNYLGTAVEQVELAIEKTLRERDERGLAR